MNQIPNAEQWVNQQFSKQVINEDIYASKLGIIESHAIFAKFNVDAILEDVKKEKLSLQEKESILDSYKWVKVKKYVDDESLSWEERYNALQEHHVQETTFLIEKIRELIN